MMPPRARLVIAVAVFWLLLGRLDPLSAETFRHITAEATAKATIDDTGALKEGKVSYRPIYKPTPRADWCKLPWISSDEAFRGKRSVGMEIQPKELTEKSDV